MFDLRPPVSLDRPSNPSGMGGMFSKLLNVAGTFIGDPALGDQIAAKAKPGYVPITQAPEQIANTIGAEVLADLKSPSSVVPDNNSFAVANAVAPAVAMKLASEGYIFPAGSLGAEFAHPSSLNAFGGQNRNLVIWGAAGIGALLLLKTFKK